MAGRRLEEQRAEHKRYKAAVERRGKPFYPYAMFHDTVMSLVVVLVIVGLAVVWRVTADGTNPGILGPWYAEKADPGTVNFIPRPDWYFYFLFYLLRIFKWPESVVLGTVGVPTIALILLFALPFVDVRRERRFSRRPVAMVGAVLVVLSLGVLTYKGATAEESLASEVVAAVPDWVAKQRLPAAARPGARLFAVSGCLSCHTYLGAGSSNLGAPDLSAEGSLGRGAQWQIQHLKCPSCVVPGSPMPQFGVLGEDNLRKIALFLESSKGPKE